MLRHLSSATSCLLAGSKRRPFTSRVLTRSVFSGSVQSQHSVAPSGQRISRACIISTEEAASSRPQQTHSIAMTRVRTRNRLGTQGLSRGSIDAIEPPKLYDAAMPSSLERWDVSRVGEFGWIDALRELAGKARGWRVGIGDYAAVLAPRAGHELVVTADTLVEDVHFRWSTTDARSLGRKALAVNL